MNQPHSNALSDGVIGRVGTVLVSVVVLAGCSTSTNIATTSPGVVTTTGSSTAVSPVPTGSTPPGLETYEDPWARAEQLGMVSPDGEYVGPVDSYGDPLIFEPVTGYGDFSGQDRFEVDNYQLVRLLARCVADHGFFLTPTEDGAGLLFQAVPPEQNQLAQAVLTACREGLRLEKPVPPTVEQLEEIHAYLIAVARCLESEGYSVTEPPSVDVFVDSQAGAWNPYDDLVADVAELSRLNQVCPQSPVGGFGDWDPGDPVIPIPTP